MNVRTKMWLLTATLLFFVQPIAAQQLSVGSAVGDPGNQVQIPVGYLAGGATVAIQYDLSFDAALLTPGAPVGGNALVGHVVRHTLAGPGKLRVVVYSTLNSQLATGSLLLLPFNIAPDAPATTTAITVSAAVLSDPFAAEVLLTKIKDGQVTIGDTVLPDEIFQDGFEDQSL